MTLEVQKAIANLKGNSNDVLVRCNQKTKEYEFKNINDIPFEKLEEVNKIIKELQKTNEDLEKRINVLENRFNALIEIVGGRK